MSTLQTATPLRPAQTRTPPSAFVPLPIPRGDLVRILGPRPEQALAAVRPFLKLDEPIGVIQSFVGGLCSPDGVLVQPVELWLIDPDAYADCEPIPVATLLKQLEQLPDIAAALPVLPGCELVQRGLSAVTIGPLLYCRKRHCVFVARSPSTLRPLTGLTDLLVWDGPPADGVAAHIYGPSAGTCEQGPIEPLDQLIRDQGVVATRAAELADGDPLLFAELEREHPCCTRDPRELSRLGSGGHEFILERLAPLSVGAAPLRPLPLGAFTFSETVRMIGRSRPTDALAPVDSANEDFDHWRRAAAQQIEARGPFLLLAGEEEGRDLVEICRLKLGLIEQTLTQLVAAWDSAGHAQLCWNDQTVRVAWEPPPAAPAAGWGFQAIVRKLGFQPVSDEKNRDGEAIVYPPRFSEDVLMPPEAVEAARYFGRTIKGGLYVKRATPEAGGANVEVLLEDSGIPRRLLCTPDVMKIDGGSWKAALAPTGKHDPDDGEGLALAGRIEGDGAAGIKAKAQLPGVSVRWFPRFGQACDQHAVGMLLLEALLAHDEREPRRLREALMRERNELTAACMAVETGAGSAAGPATVGASAGPRTHAARAWIAQRCESDSPGALWSRRNVLHHRADRAATRLDAFAPALWQAVVTLGLRMITAIPAFSFCADRAHDPARSAGGAAMPLLELRGLIALLDDCVFNRSAAVRRLRAAVHGGKKTH